ncbi:MAG: signal peptidase I [Candidatus Omnitrophota bacterium]
MKYPNAEFIELNKALLDKSHDVELRVYGGSMRPFIKSGDLLRIAPFDMKSVRIGDVIAYKSPEERLVIHRVIRRIKTDTGIMLKTKGDAQLRGRSSVFEWQLIGKVIAIKRKEQTIKLEGKKAKLISLFWTGISEISVLVYPAGRLLKKGSRFVIRKLMLCVQNFKIYRNLIKKIAPGKTEINLAKADDAVALAYFYSYDRMPDFSKRVEVLREQISFSDKSFFMLAKSNGRITGGISLVEEKEEPDGGLWTVDGLKVQLTHRGRGIGKKLIDESMKEAQNRGALRLRLFVFENAKAARELYLKLGFKKIKIPNNDSCKKEDALKRIVLEKDLSKNENEQGRQRILFCENGLSAAERRENILAYFATPLKDEELNPEQIINALGNGFNWELFFSQADKEGLAPIIYKRMLGNEKIKASTDLSVYAKFKSAYYSVARSNMLVMEHLRNILRALQDEGIRVLILKGVMLAEFVYEDIGLRPVGDIDILIKKSDLLKADRVLGSLGYSTGGHLKSYLENEQTCSINSLMYNARNCLHTSIHVHWHLINSTRPLDYWVNKINMQEIWDKAELIDSYGVRVFTLSGYHLLIYLSLHAFTHSFDRLILASDIAEVLRSYKDKIDLTMFKSACERFGVCEIMYYGLSYMSKRLNILIQEIGLVKPKKAGFWEKRLEKLFVNNVRGYKLSYLAHLLMHKLVSEKIRFLWKTFFPSKLIMASNLNLTPEQISWRNYCGRIFGNLFRIFPN